MSASMAHLEWIREMIYSLVGAWGHVNTTSKNRAFQLKYAKKEAYMIIKNMYYMVDVPKLERKYKKVYTALAIEEENNLKRARVL
jgi:hypothetical protein